MAIDVSSFEISAPGFGQALEVHRVVFDLQDFAVDDYSRHGVPMTSAVRHATRNRQVEFISGRIAAREALAAQGLPGCIPGTGAKREPLWPAGWTGSITHSYNVAMAVVVPSSPDLQNGVGLDIESVLELQLLHEIRHSIMDGAEADLLVTSKTLSFVEAGTLLFSAKESLFKALFYQVGDWFDFDAARLTSLNSEAQVFTLQLTRSLAPHLLAGRQFRGTYRTFDNKLLTLIAWDSGSSHGSYREARAFQAAPVESTQQPWMSNDQNGGPTRAPVARLLSVDQFRRDKDDNGHAGDRDHRGDQEQS